MKNETIEINYNGKLKKVNSENLNKLVDVLYELREEKKALEDRIKVLEEPFRKLMEDNEEVDGKKVKIVMQMTNRTTCDPAVLYKTAPTPEVFFQCVTVSNDKAKVMIGPENFAAISKTEPYQRRLNFKLRG